MRDGPARTDHAVAVRVRGLQPRSVAVGTAVVVADQVAKHLAGLHAEPARNPDLAFGVAGGPRPVLVVAAIAVLALFVGVVGRVCAALDISPLLPGVVAGGLVANTVDRVVLGSVRDFIATPWFVVNVADFAVAGGLAALAVTFVVRIGSRAVRADA
jgi:lipoprotein signal peptidase